MEETTQISAKVPIGFDTAVGIFKAKHRLSKTQVYMIGTAIYLSTDKDIKESKEFAEVTSYILESIKESENPRIMFLEPEVALTLWRELTEGLKALGMKKLLLEALGITEE